VNWVTRSSWRAARATSEGNPVPKHAYGIALHYSAGNVGDSRHDQCARRVREIQRYHMTTKGYADIAYSFLVCQHGFVFVGRGTAAGPASQGTNAGNLHYWGVCWLGGPKDVPSAASKASILALRLYLTQRGTGDAIRLHSQFVATSCPGRLLSGWRDLWASRNRSKANPL
jgi:hypothetical protein